MVNYTFSIFAIFSNTECAYKQKEHARFEIEKYFFRTTEELLESDLLAGLRNEVILVKGSRAFHFDRISDRLELKVHETILEINLNALVDNLNYYRSKLKPETKMVCMVKASALILCSKG